MPMENIALCLKLPQKYDLFFQAVNIFNPHLCLILSSVKLYEFFNVRMTLSLAMYFS
jgi:hypothetical protein